ncbi:ESCRT-II complex subunit VPS36 [Sporothrix brasiliensis 5110]|uniref:Vacuolar protein-sorting-associated protein 36 n=1 Tax=Sporothrix brasiliensis 5110 TaxID=1398154 RepID=A0A0C2ER45_9PEZI|nr:ESCRT-II complex subunit VPS36 [Sporothrix brasiliensis 5110]KIH88834.1 ESCRT-II complex subunit VPS36 [Sporothrix brasiliensis 5110]
MSLKQLDLTTALRPLYLPDEDLLFVQDNVGLYEGKYKILNQQNGQVYLTSHRICYVDKEDPRRYSAAVELKDIERFEFYVGFPHARSASGVGSSPARSSTASPLGGGNGSARRGPPPAAAATWVCPICSFSNPVPSNFDPESLNAHTQMPPCLACGIPPTLTHVLKAVIANAANRPQVSGSSSSNGNGVTQTLPSRPRPLSQPDPSSLEAASSIGDTTTAAAVQTGAPDPDASFQCPRCTFLNHPSLMACEMCGAPLVSRDLPAELTQTHQLRTESPGPVVAASFSPASQTGTDAAESIKLSFRGGGEKMFYERMKGSIAQRKWLLHNAPPIPSLSGRGASQDAPGSSSGNGLNRSSSLSGTGLDEPRPRIVKTAGIAGLEKRGVDMRKKNEIVIGGAFEDLEALMASAKQIVALAEQLARQTGTSTAGSSSSSDAMLLAESASSQLGLVTTKDIVGGGGSSGRESLYLSELARNLAEFLTDDARGVLRKAGGIMSLVDLWAMFNRARGGVELVSPMDLVKAARLWESLRLPVRLRTFKRSGVLVVQSSDRTDEATVRALLGWLRDIRAVPPEERGEPSVPWDWQAFGRGVSAQETAERFGWSIGVAEEELEMAEERGALCREEGIAGLRFWENMITAE